MDDCKSLTVRAHASHPPYTGFLALGAVEEEEEEEEEGDWSIS